MKQDISNNQHKVRLHRQENAKVPQMLENHHYIRRLKELRQSI